MFLLLYLSRRRHPTNMMPAGPREHWLWLGWLIVMAIWLGQPVVLYFVGDGRLISFTLLFVHPASLIAGAALALAGHLGTLWTYAAMGASWRIGVNKTERTPLITHGPYRRVRHPIYSFQVAILAGMALVLPTPASFLILAMTVNGVRMKARYEEEHMLRAHRDRYRHYMSTTGKFLPKW